MTLGVALCDMPAEFPPGPTILEAMKATEFIGVCGPMKLDNVTGTRSEDGLNFKVMNLVIDLRDLLCQARRWKNCCPCSVCQCHCDS